MVREEQARYAEAIPNSLRAAHRQRAGSSRNARRRCRQHHDPDGKERAERLEAANQVEHHETMNR